MTSECVNVASKSTANVRVVVTSIYAKFAKEPLESSYIKEPVFARKQPADATKKGKELLRINDRTRLASSARSSIWKNSFVSM